MNNANNHLYQCACGLWRYANESADDARQHEKEYHQYCGACHQEPCLVIIGQACCHDLVRYGQCSKPGHNSRV